MNNFIFRRTASFIGTQIINANITTNSDEIQALPQKPENKIESNEVAYEVVESPHYEEYYPIENLEDLAESELTFNSSGIDTIVYLHIQKTGGTTLGRRFVDDIGNFFSNLPKSLKHVSRPS